MKHASSQIESLAIGRPAGAAPRRGARVATGMASVEPAAGRATASAADPPARPAGFPAARAQAERVIAERLGSAMLTVTNLCRWTGMSRSSLYRLFDADGGVQAYIRQCRLARVAEELHRDDEIRVADIAERWGFCDAAYLARVFREVYGVTPSAYRAENRQAR